MGGGQNAIAQNPLKSRETVFVSAFDTFDIYRAEQEMFQFEKITLIKKTKLTVHSIRNYFRILNYRKKYSRFKTERLILTRLFLK